MNYLAEVLSSKKNSWNMKENDSAIIGVEIRRKRLALSITLYSLASKICSPSYLCKIERNQIQANMVILEEILERVSISGEQQDMLFNFHGVLLESVTAFVKGNREILEHYVNLGKGFENYRYRILQLMYYIVNENYYQAREVYSELVRLLDGMQDTDLMIFSVFSAILSYKEKNYKDVLDLLFQIEGLFLTDELVYLRYKYLFLASSMLGSRETYMYYDLCLGQLSRMGYYALMDELHYAMAVFALKSESNYLYQKASRLIHKEVYKNTLEVFQAYLQKDYELLHSLKDKECVPFIRYLFTTLSGETGSEEIIHHLTTFQDDYDFNSYFLKYCTCHTPEDRRAFLSSTMNKAIYCTDYFVLRFFIREIVKLNSDNGHYKDTVRLFSMYSEYL